MTLRLRRGRLVRLEAGLRARRALWLTRTGLGQRANLAQYPYSYSPAELWALCEAATAARRLDGVFVEVGVASGTTTVYLNRHLATQGAPPPYYALDTFTGFTADDIAAERARGKIDAYEGWFAVNSLALFEKSMRQHQLANVTAMQADVGAFDFSRLPAISFALADVDLFRPMLAALRGCWSRLIPGGVIVCDDCAEGEHLWDGARAAYDAFCDEQGLKPDIRLGKLGYLTKEPVRP